ncbi:MAG: PASTA domain-containing protein, partial [Acidimicrobiales bacterium]
GQDRVAVPSVVGLDEDAAVAAITSAELDAAVHRATDPSGEATSGHVWHQSPSGGSRAREGSTVLLIVAP